MHENMCFDELPNSSQNNYLDKFQKNVTFIVGLGDEFQWISCQTLNVQMGDMRLPA